MKITHVEPIILRLPNVTEDVDGTQDDLVIKVETDEGIHGWGEVDSSPEVTRAVVEAPTSHGIAHGLRHVLVGRDPFDIEQLWREMYRATIYYGREARGGADGARRRFEWWVVTFRRQRSWPRNRSQSR